MEPEIRLVEENRLLREELASLRAQKYAERGEQIRKVTLLPVKDKPFLTLNEAAAEIGCSRRFLELRIEDGEIRVFRPSGRLVRVSRGELSRWVETFSHGGTASTDSVPATAHKKVA